jgi:hypothetical protein
VGSRIGNGQDNAVISVPGYGVPSAYHALSCRQRAVVSGDALVRSTAERLWLQSTAMLGDLQPPAAMASTSRTISRHARAYPRDDVDSMHMAAMAALVVKTPYTQ